MCLDDGLARWWFISRASRTCETPSVTVSSLKSPSFCRCCESRSSLAPTFFETKSSTVAEAAVCCSCSSYKFALSAFSLPSLETSRHPRLFHQNTQNFLQQHRQRAHITTKPQHSHTQVPQTPETSPPACSAAPLSALPAVLWHAHKPSHLQWLVQHSCPPPRRATPRSQSSPTARESALSPPFSTRLAVAAL